MGVNVEDSLRRQLLLAARCDAIRIAHIFLGQPGKEDDQLRPRNRGKWWIVGEELQQLLACAVVVGDGMFAAADGLFVLDEVSDRLRQGEGKPAVWSGVRRDFSS
jgi:hypothetical protein